MNYNEIAKLVHGLVKDQEPSNLSTTQISNQEVAVIKNCFSELKVSGNVANLESIPLIFWA